MTTKPKPTFPAEFSELIAAFESESVEYLVVGGYAVGAHGRPRATKDLDLWIAGGENLGARGPGAPAPDGSPLRGRRFAEAWLGRSRRL